MASYVGADSLGYLSLEALTDTAAGPNKGPDKGLCAACFTGNYPIPVQPDLVGQGIAKGKGSTHPLCRGPVDSHRRRPLTWPPATQPEVASGWVV